MLVRKIWNHAIKLKKGFMPKKGSIYPFSREKREEVREFVQKKGIFDFLSHLRQHQCFL